MRTYTSKRATNAPTLQVEFELDGVEFKGDGNVSMLDLSEFARLASQGVDTTDPAAVAIIADIYLSLLGEQTYQRFRAHCRRSGTNPEVLLAIIGDMAGERVDRPTDRSSDSSDGPPPTPDSAKVVSFSRATVEQVPAPAQFPTEAPEPTAETARQVVSYG